MTWYLAVRGYAFVFTQRDLSHTSVLYYYYNITTLEYISMKEEPQETQPIRWLSLWLFAMRLQQKRYEYNLSKTGLYYFRCYDAFV